MKYNNSFEKHYDLKHLLDNEGISYIENHSHITLALCPACGKENKLVIDKEKKVWICYSCYDSAQQETGMAAICQTRKGTGGLWAFLELLGYSVDEIKRIYKDKNQVSYAGQVSFDERESGTYELDEYELNNRLIPLNRAKVQIETYTEAYSYLWGRNVRTPKQYKDFDIHYDPTKKRITFPAYNAYGLCLGAQSRDITNRHKSKHLKCQNPECKQRYNYYFTGEDLAPESCPGCGRVLALSEYPKSLNSANFPKTEFFFNERNIDWHSPVVLVEGPFDAINVNNSIAFLGKTLSETQVNILLDNLKAPIILYMDGDEAGDRASKSIYNKLRCLFSVKIVASIDGEDPGEFTLEENQSRINAAMLPHIWYEYKGYLFL